MIELAISVDMTEELRTVIQALPEEAWKPLLKVTDQGWIVGRKEWAEVEFLSSMPSRKKRMKPDRYLAIRIRPAQGELFQDGTPYHYFAVITNMWSWNGERLLQWQRERCGTVEKVHDVLKNDLAGGVLPAKRFFVNAAWWRVNLLAYNVLSVMKRKALPQSWWPARLKGLIFQNVKKQRAVAQTSIGIIGRRQNRSRFHLSEPIRVGLCFFRLLRKFL